MAVRSPLEGRLIRLRAREPEDEPKLFRWFNDPEVTGNLVIRYPLTHAGEPAMALQKISSAIALNPLCPDHYWWTAGGANFLLHVVVPVLALSDWLLVGRGRGRVHWWHPVAWLAYPALYVVAAVLILNEAGRRAPYYFLDPASVGVATVVLNVCVLGGCVLAVGYALLAVNRLATPARIDTV